MTVKEVSVTHFFVRGWSLGMRQHKMAEIRATCQYSLHRASTTPPVNTVYMLQNTLGVALFIQKEMIAMI